MRILVVEDNKFVNSCYCAILEDAGHSVTVCHDGESFVERMNEQHPELVLLDILLPKQNGLEALAELRQSENPMPEIPVVVLSNLGDEDTKSQARALGVQAYFVKADVDDSDIVHIVHSYEEAGV